MENITTKINITDDTGVVAQEVEALGLPVSHQRNGTKQFVMKINSCTIQAVKASAKVTALEGS